MTTGAKFPFLVVEVANSQTQKSVDKKVFWWLQGSKQHLKLIIVLRVKKKKKPNSIHVYLDVIKPRIGSAYVPNHPDGFRVEKDYVLENVEVYPGTPQTNFAIHYADVLPRDCAQSFQSNQPPATIDLNLFHECARQAVTNLTVLKGDDSSSGYDSDQDPTPNTPTDPEKSLPKDEVQPVQAEEESSSDYMPDDSDNDEPHLTRS